MKKNIKYSFTINLFYLSTILLSLYISPMRATNKEMIENKISWGDIEATYKDILEEDMKRIEWFLKRNKGTQLKLSNQLNKLKNYYFKQCEKYFLKFSHNELPSIISRLKNVQSTGKKLNAAIEVLMRQMYAEKIENEMETKELLSEKLKKIVNNQAEIEFQQMRDVIQQLYKVHQSDLALWFYDFSWFILDEIQKNFLKCSITRQESLLPELKKLRILITNQVNLQKYFMPLILHTAQKSIQNKILEHNIERMLENHKQNSIQSIENLLRINNVTKPDLWNHIHELSNFAFEENRKFFSKLSIKELRTTFYYTNKSLHASYKLIKSFYELGKKMAYYLENKDISDESVSDHSYLNQINLHIKVKFESIIQRLKEQYENREGADNILPNSDRIIINNFCFYHIENIKNQLLEISFTKKKLILPYMDNMFALEDQCYQFDREWIKSIPNTLIKEFKILSNTVSQRVHKLLYPYYTELDRSVVISYIILLCLV